MKLTMLSRAVKSYLDALALILRRSGSGACSTQSSTQNKAYTFQLDLGRSSESQLRLEKVSVQTGMLVQW